MNAISGLLKRWWDWSTGPGKRRKVIGFGVPLLVLVALASALTPEPPEASDEQIALHTATATTGIDKASPTTTTAANSPAATTTRPPATATVAAAATPLPVGWRVAVVEDVIDGDTIILEGGQRLRYIGIDTPETVHPSEPVGCYGPEASARNKELVLGQTVVLEPDVSNTDIYDRLLRYVFLEDGRMVNEVLVAEGYATSYPYDPDTGHQDQLDAAQAEAMAFGRGMWSACEADVVPTATPFIVPTSPASGVSGECPLGCEMPPAGCVIKGNISSEHIYHAPGQQHYERTEIDPEKGERWFCTEAEAVANGWRKALR